MTELVRKNRRQEAQNGHEREGKTPFEPKVFGHPGEESGGKEPGSGN